MPLFFRSVSFAKLKKSNSSSTGSSVKSRIDEFIQFVVVKCNVSVYGGLGPRFERRVFQDGGERHVFGSGQHDGVGAKIPAELPHGPGTGTDRETHTRTRLCAKVYTPSG